MIVFAVFLVFLLCATKGDNNLHLTKDGKFSIECIDINMCQPVQNIFEFLTKERNLQLAVVTDLLKSYQCNLDNKLWKVWCSVNSIAPPNVEKHENLKLLPQDCGPVGITRNIINGKKTDILEFPWMALISFQSDLGPVFRCGGTIINDQYILTAAHCIVNKTPLFVRVGDHNINTPDDCQNDDGDDYCAPAFRDLKIIQAIPHPDYNNNEAHSNDIGLLKVSKINLTKANTQPICLPYKSKHFDLINKSVTVTGWGVTDKKIYSPDLLKTSLWIVELDICKKALATPLFYTQLCAYANNTDTDTCKGDSGGPLQSVFSFEKEAKYYQHGIVSFGARNCNSQLGVYTHVAFYMNWILDNIAP